MVVRTANHVSRSVTRAGAEARRLGHIAAVDRHYSIGDPATRARAEDRATHLAFVGRVDEAANETAYRRWN
jgi:hypothetical protein